MVTFDYEISEHNNRPFVQKFKHEYPQFNEDMRNKKQTITVAVSAILIAAGLVTAPCLVSNPRDRRDNYQLH